MTPGTRGLVAGEQVRAVDREFPFQPEVAFGAGARIHRIRDEEGARPDLLPDRRVPDVPAPQFAAVEPHRDAP